MKEIEDIKKEESGTVEEEVLKGEVLATVMECNRTGADCECCGNYDEYTIDLSCFCQITQNERANVGGLLRCPICSGDEY